MEVNSIERLERRVLKELPKAKASLDRPVKPSGHWWLDLSLDDHRVAVEWRPKQGFGIHCSAEPQPFSGPEEVLENAREAAERVVELLRRRQYARPPRSVVLKELREMASLTQVELAEKLGVGQATISKMERRKDITLAALRKWIQSIGGDLEILAKFPDEVVRIGQFDDAEDIDDAA